MGLEVLEEADDHFQAAVNVVNLSLTAGGGASAWKGDMDKGEYILLRCHENPGSSLLLGAGFEVDEALNLGLLAVGTWDIAVAADLSDVVSVVRVRATAEG